MVAFFAARFRLCCLRSLSCSLQADTLSALAFVFAASGYSICARCFCLYFLVYWVIRRSKRFIWVVILHLAALDRAQSSKSHMHINRRANTFCSPESRFSFCVHRCLLHPTELVMLFTALTSVQGHKIASGVLEIVVHQLHMSARSRLHVGRPM